MSSRCASLVFKSMDNGYLRGTIFVHCKYVLLLLVNKELTGLKVDRKGLGGRIRLGGCWEEEGWSLGRCYEMQSKQDEKEVHTRGSAQHIE